MYRAPIQEFIPRLFCIIPIEPISLLLCSRLIGCHSLLRNIGSYISCLIQYWNIAPAHAIPLSSKSNIMKQQVHIHYLRSRTTDVRSPWILRAVYRILLIVILTNPWQIHDLSVFIRILKGRNRKFLLIRRGLVADLNLLSAFQRRGKIFAGKGVGINIVIGIICSGTACSIIRGNLSCNLAHGIAVKCLHTTNILCP